MPRGCSPRSGMRATSVDVAVSMTERSAEHQFVTRTRRPSGVTATYFGTAPTGTAFSMAYDCVLTRYTRLVAVPSPAVHESRPSGPKPAPYIA